jgi:hypothetical protein
MPQLSSSKQTVSVLAFCILSAAGRVLAADNAPGQPKQVGKLNGFEIVGNSAVSGEQVTARQPLLHLTWLTFDPSHSWAPKTRSTLLTKRKTTRRKSKATLLGLQVRSIPRHNQFQAADGFL